MSVLSHITLAILACEDFIDYQLKTNYYLPQLLKLRQREACVWVMSMLVVELVPLLQPQKLLPDDAHKGLAH